MKTKIPHSIPLSIVLALGIQASFFCRAIKAQAQESSGGTVTIDCPAQTTAGTPVTFTANISGNARSLPLKWELSAGTITSGQGTPSITIDTTGLGGQSVTASVRVGEAGQSRTLSCTWPIDQPSSPVARQIGSGSQNQSNDVAADQTETRNQPEPKTSPVGTEPSGQASDQPSAPTDNLTAGNTEPTNETEKTTPPVGTEPSSQASDQTSAANAELQAQVSRLQNQLTQLQSQLNSATQGQADNLSPSAKTDLQNQASQIQSQLEGLQGKLKTNIQGQTGDQVSSANAKLQTQVTQLQDQLGQFQGKLTATSTNPLNKVTSEKAKLPGKLGKLASLGGLQGALDKVTNKATTKAQDEVDKVNTTANAKVQGHVDKVNTAVNTKLTDSTSQVQNQASKLQNQLGTANQPLASVEHKMQSLLSTAKPDAKPYLELAQQDLSTAQELFAAGKLQQGTQQTKATVQTLIDTSQNGGVDTTALQKSLVEGVEARVNKAVAGKEAEVGSDNPNVQQAREDLNQGHALLEQGAFTKALDAFSSSLQRLSVP